MTEQFIFVSGNQSKKPLRLANIQLESFVHLAAPRSYVKHFNVFCIQPTQICRCTRPRADALAPQNEPACSEYATKPSSCSPQDP